MIGPDRPPPAVLIVGHGERGGAADNSLLLALRKDVAGGLPGAIVVAGVLSGMPPLAEALAAIDRAGCRDMLVYPLFMSDGYFVRDAVPRRICSTGFSRPWRVLPPLGLDPGLPSLINDAAVAAAVNTGWRPAETRLLLVGHGSAKSRASAEATEAAAAGVRTIGSLACVSTAFLEEAPLLIDALRRDEGRTVVIGFLSGEGLHARDDIPAAIAATGSGAVYVGPISGASGIAALIRRALAAEIEVQAD